MLCGNLLFAMFVDVMKVFGSCRSRDGDCPWYVDVSLLAQESWTWWRRRWWCGGVVVLVKATTRFCWLPTAEKKSEAGR
jgi:hypothetical protein